MLAIRVAIFILVWVASTATAVAVPFVYLTQDGSTENAVHRIDAMDGPLEAIQDTGLMGPIGVDVDLAGGKIYWTDQNLGLIQRKNIDGTGPVEDLMVGGIGPHDLALDIKRGRMYFSDRGTSSTDAALKRASLDGSDIETIISGTAPAYLELDFVGRKIYFAHGGSGPTLVSRADLEGGNAEVILSMATDNVRGIALDVRAGLIYLGLRSQLDGSFRIAFADLDGANFGDFLTDLPEWPHDLALDPHARQLYWSFSEGVHRVNLDLAGGILAGMNPCFTPAFGLASPLRPQSRIVAAESDVSEPGFTSSLFLGPPEAERLKASDLPRGRA